MNKIFIYILPFLILLNSCNDFYQPKPMYNSINEINAINIDGGNHRIITDGWDAKILRYNDKIVFRKNNTLYSIKFDGTELTVVNNFQNLLFYSLSYDGEKIALITSSNYLLNLYVINSDGSNLKLLYNGLNWPLVDPQFSYDNNEIIFCRDGDIGIVKITGSDIKIIRKHPDKILYGKPHFIFDNKNILYFEESQTVRDKTNLHLYNLITSKDSLILTYVKNAIYAPSIKIALDGRILFIEGHENFDLIRILDINNNKINNIGKGFYGDISEDGNEITYSDSKSIYLNNSVGNDEQIIYTVKDFTKSVLKPYISKNKQTIIFQTSYPELDE